MIKFIKIAKVVIIVLLVTYIGSYMVLSRRAFVQSRKNNIDVFYFFTQKETKNWKKLNDISSTFFYPLIAVDNMFGTGLPVGKNPLWDHDKINEAEDPFA
ncbi:MAG: hypothetical protein KAI43_03275 [Candidatus Aureabacteria bacterium]|nr:hypothetical protein [Candidatus Auribacterota bacterium]